MPLYTVRDRTTSATWNVTGTAPGVQNPPKAALQSQLGWAEIEKGASYTSSLPDGFRTKNISESAVFCVLWRPEQSQRFDTNMMTHIQGGPDPSAIDWAGVNLNFGPGGTFHCILVVTNRTSQADQFATTAQDQLGVRLKKMWIYDAQFSGFNFCFDRKGNAGEF